MLDKIFDKLPYEFLGRFKFIQVIMAATAIGLAITMVYVISLYTLTEDEYQQQVQTRDKKDALLKDNKATVASKQRVDEEFSVVYAAFEDMRRQMPKESEIPELIRKIHSLSKDLDLEFIDFYVDEKRLGKISDFYKEIPMRLVIKGDSWNTVGMFDALQDMIRVVSVSDLTMEMVEEKKTGQRRADEANAQKKPRTTFNTKVYAFVDGAESKPKPPPPAPAAAAPAPGEKPHEPAKK